MANDMGIINKRIMADIEGEISMLQKNINSDFVIKGSTALFLQGLIKRKPNDIDLSIKNDNVNTSNNKIFNDMHRSLPLVEVNVNNHFLKSFTFDKKTRVEWVTKQSFPNWGITRYHENCWILLGFWAAYSKILQVAHLKMNYQMDINNVKFINSVFDLIILINNDYLYEKLLKYINLIVDFDICYSLQAYFPTAKYFTTGIFLELDHFLSILEESNKMSPTIKGRITKLFQSVNEKNRQLIKNGKKILLNRDKIIKLILEPDSVMIWERYSKRGLTLLPIDEVQSIRFIENTLVFKSRNDIANKVSIILSNLFLLNIDPKGFLVNIDDHITSGEINTLNFEDLLSTLLFASAPCRTKEEG